jgi:enoyl-CoA hydratase/carnithine racemase
MSTPPLLIEAGPVTTLRFNRPEKRNALNVAAYEALNEALARAKGDASVRVVLFVGQAGVFTAGNDIVDFAAQPPVGPDSPVRRFVESLLDFPKPMVAAVDGPAIGVGTTMLAHCDLVVASSRARFQLPFVNLGLVPEAASTLLLPLFVGRARANRWLLLGEPIDAPTALEAGLVTEMVEPDALEARARALAEALAARPPEALLETKRLLRAALGDAMRATFERESEAFAARLVSAEAAQAFAAFMTRKPG